MGTVSIDNSGVEERLQAVEDKVTEGNTLFRGKVADVLSTMMLSISQLKILNMHQRIITNNHIEESDISDEDT
jgi:hypothetical protein